LDKAAIFWTNNWPTKAAALRSARYGAVTSHAKGT
jgi:hypothetical protein